METTNKPDDQPKSDGSNQEDVKDGIATELRIAREAKGYSFADLHRLTGLSRTTLHQYESGARKPGARELILLSRALEVSPNRLLLGTEEPFVGGNGVLVPLVRLAKTDPYRALGVGALMLPTVAAILAAVGDNTLLGLATLADESLRARDPETYGRFCKLVESFCSADLDGLQHKSKEDRDKWARETFEGAGFPPGTFDPDK